jgi:ATP-binding cassette, subfamily B, bacterial
VKGRRVQLRALATMVSTAFRADPWRAVGVAVLSGVGSVVTTLFALWLKLIVDGAAERDFEQIAVAAAAIAVTGTLGHLMLWGAFSMRTVLGERTSVLIDQRIIAVTAGLPGLEHHERPDYQNELAMLRTQRAMFGQVVGVMVNTFGVSLRIVATIVLLFSVHPLMALLPLFAVPSLLAARRVSELEQRAMEKTVERERVSDHLFELATTPAAGKELRIFGTGPELVRRHRALWREIDRERTALELRGALLAVLAWAVFAGGFVAAIVFVANRAVNGDATAGDVLMAVTLAAQVNAQVQGAVNMVTALMGILRVVGRYLWLVDYAAEATRPVVDPLPVPDRLERGIELDHVTFGYPGVDEVVLEDVSLLLPAGLTVAIVGENGAGKTTLVKLLCGFYQPGEGRITVDGSDLTRFEPVEWRERLAAGFQDFVRFELRAVQAVGVGELAHVDDVPSVERALVRAGASDVVDDLPSGMQTQLGRSFEGGVDLSGGQWQKLALGRAMMRPTPLLLTLDEPTASLDAQTEHDLFERYAAGARQAAQASGAITVLVSHRFSTVRMADLIVVLDGGRVVEAGSHDELIAKRGLYADLFELQARAYR